MEAHAKRIQEFATKRRFDDYVFLGQGVHYWLAQEAALKVTELSSSYTQFYHSLEFRHGPRSIAGPKTLITFFMSDVAAEAETKLCAQLKGLGAATCVIVNHATPKLRKHADLLIELALDETGVCTLRCHRDSCTFVGNLDRPSQGTQSRCAEESDSRGGPRFRQESATKKERCLSGEAGTSSSSGPRLRRTLTLWDLVLYGVIVIQPVAPMSVFGVLSERGRGHVVTAILIAMVAMLFTGTVMAGWRVPTLVPAPRLPT